MISFDFYEDILISAMAVLIYGWFFQIRWKYLLFGIPPFFIALGLEELSLSYFSYMIILIVIAPIVEEISKFVFTFYRKDVKTGIAVGLMFALIENALYFNSFASIFLLVFLLREFTDPILHSTTTSISTFTWKREIGYVGLPVAILMHSVWNYYGILTINSPYLVFVIAIIYGIILYVIWNRKYGRSFKN